MRKTLIIIAVAMLNFSTVMAGEILTGRVIRVKDGDSFVMRSGGLTYDIRMYGIDAPETGQPHGAEAKEQLQKLIGNKNVKVEITDSDHYGRLIGKVYAGKRYINLQMIKTGYAHWYRKYAPHDTDLQSAETIAKTNNLGLWSTPNPVQPSTWRKIKHPAANPIKTSE